MIFKVLRDKKVLFQTDQESCVPDAQQQKQLKKDGYKIVVEDDNGSRNSKKANKKQSTR